MTNLYIDRSKSVVFWDGDGGLSGKGHQGSFISDANVLYSDFVVVSQVYVFFQN